MADREPSDDHPSSAKAGTSPEDGGSLDEHVSAHNDTSRDQDEDRDRELTKRSSKPSGQPQIPLNANPATESGTPTNVKNVASPVKDDDEGSELGETSTEPSVEPLGSPKVEIPRTSDMSQNGSADSPHEVPQTSTGCESRTVVRTSSEPSDEPPSSHEDSQSTSGGQSAGPASLNDETGDTGFSAPPASNEPISNVPNPACEVEQRQPQAPQHVLSWRRQCRHDSGAHSPNQQLSSSQYVLATGTSRTEATPIRQTSWLPLT